MDESWRMRMGTTTTKQPNNLPPRRSTEETTSSNRQNVFRGYETLDPEDFDDVFGGPPRTVISRQYSVEGDFARSAYEDMFRKPRACTDYGDRSDRTLPEFRIPVSVRGGGRRNEEDFYGDIFGNLRRSRSRSKSQTNSNSKSKSNSSSILSSEELSPFRPAIVDEDDASFSSFASKLRPINVSSKWNTSEKRHELHQTAEGGRDYLCKSPSFVEMQCAESEYIHKFNGYHSGCSRKAASPETISFGPASRCSVKESVEDVQLNSPSSIVSSLNQEQDDEASTIHDKPFQWNNSDREEDDEVMSSYVIEINPRSRERIDDTFGLDEAIAWAKQKCQPRPTDKEWNKREAEKHDLAGKETPNVNKSPEVQTAKCRSIESHLFEKQKERRTEPLQHLENDVQMELELLDEDIKLWSAGKEQNIQLLLSTLHHILWPSSGWNMMPLTNLKDSSNVKKAYQKARLCLHPDKLQQRGATIPQKYVAEKAFPILQVNLSHEWLLKYGS